MTAGIGGILQGTFHIMTQLFLERKTKTSSSWDINHVFTHWCVNTSFISQSDLEGNTLVSEKFLSSHMMLWYKIWGSQKSTGNFPQILGDTAGSGMIFSCAFVPFPIYTNLSETWEKRWKNYIKSTKNWQIAGWVKPFSMWISHHAIHHPNAAGELWKLREKQDTLQPQCCKQMGRFPFKKMFLSSKNMWLSWKKCCRNKQLKQEIHYFAFLERFLTFPLPTNHQTTKSAHLSHTSNSSKTSSAHCKEGAYHRGVSGWGRRQTGKHGQHLFFGATVDSLGWHLMEIHIAR